MRSIPSSFLTSAVILALWVGPRSPASAQTETILVPLTQPWSYFLTNANGPQGNWRTNDYPAETNWPVGTATFGVEDPAVLAWPVNTPFAAPVSGGPPTVYFRTHFQYLGASPSAVTFVFSNILDDGAVFYINGREVQRVRMPTSAITYASFASGGPPTEGQFERFVVIGGNSFVQPGDNVLAVEVHNVNTSNSDTVFAGSLSALHPIPLVITQDLPTQIVAEEGKGLTLAIGVQGSNPSYRWFRNSAPVSTSPTYSFYPITNLQGAQYKVVVTNILNKVTSEVAVLTVLPDVYPPGLISAIAQDSEGSNKIEITFSEAIHPKQATNASNYSIRRVGEADCVIILNVTHVGNDIVLKVGGSNWIWGQDYLLTVNGLADVNFRTNWISPLSNQVAVVFPKLVSGFDNPSLCWDPLAGAGYPPQDNWTQLEADDSSPEWFPVTGIAYRDPATPIALCAALGTPIDYASRTARYFRRHFTVPTIGAKGYIRLRYVIDDGAVFYINGQEISRYNITSGAVSPITAANSSAYPDCLSVTLPFTQLSSGENVLAVEVHNSIDSSDLDIYFGAEISAIILPEPIVHARPALSIAPTETGVRLDWPTDAGLLWTLEVTTNLEGGPWLPVASTPPFQTNVVSGETQFYRLRTPGAQ